MENHGRNARFSFDTDAKEVAAGIEIGEKMLRYCIINSMKMETKEKKIKAIPGVVEMELFTPHRKKNFSLFR
ncbi:MAG: hypothetical protein ACLTJ5_03700 [Clostridium sp.]